MGRRKRWRVVDYKHQTTEKEETLREYFRDNLLLHPSLYYDLSNTQPYIGYAAWLGINFLRMDYKSVGYALEISPYRCKKLISKVEEFRYPYSPEGLKGFINRLSTSQV
tara:strand:- start:443 stop:769 length:327 start_codon:yes stop_codon:yes gene_type:complete